MLIPSKDQPSLYDEHPPDSLKTVARARTLTMLPRLAGDRKARVVQFLYESGLITRDRGTIDLNGADLRGAILGVDPLSGAGVDTLSGADLRGTILIGARLSRGNLRDADLSDANLSEADLAIAKLIGAVLSGAKLSRTDLSGATLNEANLSEAGLSGANLSGAWGWGLYERLSAAKSLKGATMPNGQKYEDWLKSKGREKK
jgi:uncharacterized protein YjbI with pentapeptide repeats